MNGNNYKERRRRRKALNWHLQKVGHRMEEDGPVRIIMENGILKAPLSPGQVSSEEGSANCPKGNDPVVANETGAVTNSGPLELVGGCEVTLAQDRPRHDSGTITIYVDGACEPNPGRGGWAYIRICEGTRTEAAGAEQNTTSNRVELRAAIEALTVLPELSEVEVFCDSPYLIKGITTWLPRWKQARWRTTAGSPVKNREQWEQLDRLCSRHSITWNCIQNQSTAPELQRCSRLANQQAGIAEGQERWWLRTAGNAA